MMRAVGISARAFVFIAAFGAASAEGAFAQRSLTSVLLPTDTAGVRKAAKTSDFARHQLANARVLQARTEKRFELKKLLRERGLEYPAAEIFMRVFKREKQLEMWVRPVGQDNFIMLKSYAICALSDKLGPKRTQGDLQTPEGFYFIDNFNPSSDYLLSLHVNYPNESDRILGDGKVLGGNIFIHGGCKTAGCMALTNEGIKEVYLLAMEAREQGQTRIPVHIFPARLSDNGLQQLANVFGNDPDLVRFWSNMKAGYDYFEQKHAVPLIKVNKRGRYQVDREDKSGLLGEAVAQTGTATKN